MTKRQWGAFYGTDLELQLRRRGIDTIILCGISTNIGVESTARNAWELVLTWSSLKMPAAPPPPNSIRAA
ncbi:nicotinamidase/isochorismatase family protein [Klebsiella pneumoniae]|uniref:Nicotinamidase/isochorismatase family protein n=1 Tax=Klebsiella pneumoniae TaxID=573 RepID=A0A377VZP7_KLEPN|nr:nicotinamidase/isochorismatase family protein [Klebsiella pneumoniae]